MNDQPNGRSKHDPRQSSHNRDHLEKKKKNPRLGGGNGGRDHHRGAGLAAARGETGSHHARSCPSVSSGFPPSSLSDRPCEAGNRDPPARLARSTEKGGYSSR